MTCQYRVRGLQQWTHLPEKSGTSGVNLPSLSTGQGISSPFPTMSAQHSCSKCKTLIMAYAGLPSD